MTDMEFKQAATFMNELQAQATGVKGIAPQNIGEYVSVGTTLLKTARDPVANAISQLLGRTILSIRPYTAKFKSLYYDESRFGNMLRKISIADKNIEDNEAYLWPVGTDGAPESGQGEPVIGDGYSVDMYRINKPDFLQTNFYGQATWQDHYTAFDDQYDVCFRDPSEMMRFLSMVAQNMSDKHESYMENIARVGLLGNMIGSIRAENNPDRNIHLLTEYNEATHQSFTKEDVMKPENYAPFMRWCFAFIGKISDRLTERTTLYQTVVNGKDIKRHTPKSRQKFFFYAPLMHDIEANVLATTYNEQYLKLAVTEKVNFFQSITSPDSINLTIARTNENGMEVREAVTVDNIFGLLMDEQAAGFGSIAKNQWATPHNAAGEYTNFFFKDRFRLINDMTEKAVLFTLD